MFSLSSLPTMSMNRLMELLGHRPYQQYTIGGYGGYEMWNTRFVIVSDDIAEPTLVLVGRKRKAKGARSVAVLALPTRAHLTHELAMAMVGLGGGYATLRTVKIVHNQSAPGEEAAIARFDSTGEIEWKAGMLVKSLHRVPREGEQLTGEDAADGYQLTLGDEVLAQAGLA